MQKQCTQCSAQFEVTDEDLAFYDKVSSVFDGNKCSIPVPTHCSNCRLQQRLAWRNMRSMHRRNCDLCQSNILSVHPISNGYPVYCGACWWSDNWDPITYANELDLSKSFIEQFYNLQQRVPQLAIMNDNGVSSENCEYCQDFAFGKNCYFVTGSWRIEDSYFSNNCNHVRNVMDCDSVNVECELVYESLLSQKLYRCAYLQNSDNCSECFMGYNLKGCKNCIACYGLRQKEYHIFNKPFSREEFEAEKEKLQLHSYAAVQSLLAEWRKWTEQFPRKASFYDSCEECTGDYLFNCKGCYSFNIYDSEGAQHCDEGGPMIHCYDIFQSGNPEWCYYGITPDDSYMTHFGTWCWKDKYVLYSDNCHSSEHLLGCVSLKRKKFCILNKQYSEEEYNDLVPKIIEKMQTDGEWGEFFPASMSPFAYNETVAQEYFPLTKGEVLAKDWKWRDPDDKLQDITKTIPAEKLPDTITDIPDDILNWAITCEATNRPFKIIKQELDFYRKMNLPVPHLHPDERHRRRMALRNPRKLWGRKCDKCNKDIQTSYSPERPETVYCDECYLAEVY